MTTLIGTLPKKIYSNDAGDYHIYTLVVAGGKRSTAVILGKDKPKPFKTVKYQLTGEWRKHKKYGENFHIDKFLRWDLRPRNSEELKLVRDAVKRLGPYHPLEDKVFGVIRDYFIERSDFMRQRYGCCDDRLGDKSDSEVVNDRLHGVTMPPTFIIATLLGIDGKSAKVLLDDMNKRGLLLYRKMEGASHSWWPVGLADELRMLGYGKVKD